MAHLEITKGKAVVQSPLRDEAMTIGRQPGNSIVINDPDISRRHCVIEPAEGRYRIYDVGSRNGIIVNGQRVQRSELRAGDVITLGKTVAKFLETPIRPPRKRKAVLRNWLIWVPAVSIFGVAAFVVAWATGMLGRDFPPDALREKLNIPAEVVKVDEMPTSQLASASAEDDNVESAEPPTDAVALPSGGTEPRQFEEIADRLRYEWIDPSVSMEEAEALLGRFVSARFIGRPTRDMNDRLVWELPPEGEITAVLEAFTDDARTALEALEQEPLLLEAELAGMMRRDRDGSRLFIRVGVIAIQRAWGNSDTALQPATRELLNKRIIIHPDFTAKPRDEQGN